MRPVRVLIALSTVILSGCAVMAVPYASPPGTGHPKFTVDNNLSDPMFVHAYDDATECQGRRLISFLPPRGSKAVGLSVDKDFAFSLAALVPERKYCKMFVSFRPERGNDYFSTLEYDNTSNTCVLSLKKRNRDGEFDLLETASIREQGGLALDESGSFCKKKQ